MNKGEIMQILRDVDLAFEATTAEAQSRQEVYLSSCGVSFECEGVGLKMSNGLVNEAYCVYVDDILLGEINHSWEVIPEDGVDDAARYSITGKLS